MIHVADHNPHSSLNRRDVSNLTIPDLPGLELSFQFDAQVKLLPPAVYQTAIQVMYDLVQRPWDQAVEVMITDRIKDFNVLIMFVNSQPSTASDQMIVGHCVAALYRSIVIMTDGVLFTNLRCLMNLRHKDIGGLSIVNIDGTVASNATVTDALSTTLTGPAINAADSGQVVDPENPKLVIKYHFFGKAIKSKEVSMAILEALASLGPRHKTDTCQDFEAISPGGECGIFIDAIPSHVSFTYGFAARILKLLYQLIIVPSKRWGDLYLDVRYNGNQFGALRMLKFGDGANNVTQPVEQA
ncbi:MAG: hypothetical protein Q9222_002716 [Ikaeria aurantiellina]